MPETFHLYIKSIACSNIVRTLARRQLYLNSYALVTPRPAATSKKHTSTRSIVGFRLNLSYCVPIPNVRQAPNVIDSLVNRFGWKKFSSNLKKLTDIHKKMRNCQIRSELRHFYMSYCHSILSAF